jgi:hypothetical protein
VTLDEFLAELAQLPDVVLHPGASEGAIDKLERRYGIRLPAIHRELLLRSNGIEAAGGYLRLYGMGPDAGVDMEAWNDPELWKFSWQPFVAELFCFGGNCWGYQFAYRLADLSADVPDAPIHILADVDRRIRPSEQTFEEYLHKGFLANARQQRSEFGRRVRKKVGDLAPGELLTLAPHPIIGGPERVGNVMKMPAATVMVITGDTQSEWLRAKKEGGTGDTEVTGVVPYVDEKGRARIRLTSRPRVPDAE